LQNIFKDSSKQLTYFLEHPHTTILAIFTSPSDFQMPSLFFLRLAYYFMMSECSYTWCVVSVLVAYLCCIAWLSHSLCQAHWSHSQSHTIMNF